QRQDRKRVMGEIVRRGAGDIQRARPPANGRIAANANNTHRDADRDSQERQQNEHNDAEGADEFGAEIHSSSPMPSPRQRPPTCRISTARIATIAAAMPPKMS